jgi:hypothetical protein
MPRATIKKTLTQCGMLASTAPGSGRARVIARDGNKLTYRWPCGYERTEVLMQGPGRLRQPASPDMVAFFARYWAQGVTYECPRCRRAALKAKKQNPPRPRGRGMTE